VYGIRSCVGKVWQIEVMGGWCKCILWCPYIVLCGLTTCKVGFNVLVDCQCVYDAFASSCGNTIGAGDSGFGVAGISFGCCLLVIV